jgi:hypothetical protein
MNNCPAFNELYYDRIDISYAFNNELFSDFIIENDNGTEVLYLHKIILQSNEYFKLLFSNNFKKVDKLCFNNLDIPRMLIYYIYVKKVNIKVEDLHFDELIIILTLAHEWLMNDYVNVIVNGYLHFITPNIDQLMKLSIYCKDIFTHDKVKKIINNDIHRVKSEEEFLKYENMDTLDIENLHLRPQIILYTYFKRFKDVNQLFKKHKCIDIYNILRELKSFNKKIYNIYSDFCDFISKNINNILDSSYESIKSDILIRNYGGLRGKKYIIESIYPLSLRSLELLKEDSYVYRDKKTKEKIVIIQDIQSKIDNDDSLILVNHICKVDPPFLSLPNHEYYSRRECVFPEILKIKTNDIEVSSASKHENINIIINSRLGMDKTAIVFVYKKAYLYSI